MTEIKYRGKVGGQWWYTTPFVDDPLDDNWFQFWALVNPKTVGQYTGRKDKHHKEIFAGDIVKYFNDNFIIIWCKEDAAFGMQYETDEWDVRELYANNVSVIGNKFDKPELLKQ